MQSGILYQHTLKHSILISDDEQAIRESLYLFLKEEGYDCQSAKDGGETIDKACSKQFDLVILDLNMPRSHGLVALKKIKECHPKTIVIILTSYYDIEDAAIALKLGASKLLLKPIDFDELLDIIEDILSKKKVNPSN